MRRTCQDALIEAAALQGNGEFKDLEEALQSFLDKNGVEGLIELFLTNYVAGPRLDGSRESRPAKEMIETPCPQHLESQLVRPVALMSNR